MLSNSQPLEESSSSKDQISITLFPNTSNHQEIKKPNRLTYLKGPGRLSFSSSPSSSDDVFLSLPPSPTEEPATCPDGVGRLPADPRSPTERDTQHHVDASASPISRGRSINRRYSIAGATVNLRKRLTSPDRFVPARGNSYTSAKPFRLSKSPQLLSPGEKLLRRRDHSVDPFVQSNTLTPAGISRRNTVPERRFSPRYLPHLVSDAIVAAGPVRPQNGQTPRQISAGAVWNVGGPSVAAGGPPAGISDGHGGLLGSHTNAPMYLAKFIEAETPHQELERHESRLALALDIDQASRVLSISTTSPNSSSDLSPTSPQYGKRSPFTWKDNAWMRAESAAPGPKPVSKPTQHSVPSTPFRVLDAPLLRDDFYCSTLAYSYTARILAVGLSSRVYLWSEIHGVQHPPLVTEEPANHVTSLSFSSPQGGRSILAVGRQGGQLSLWSTFDSDVRFEIHHPNPISCVSFRQIPTRRASEHSRGNLVDTEDLAVGDDIGNVWYYAVEWVGDSKSRSSSGWNGGITLLAKVSAHTQQICGLAWSPDGTYLATGGNDNACLLFELSDILGSSELLKNATVTKSSPNHAPHLQHERGLSRFAYTSHFSRIFDRYHRASRAPPNASPELATPNSGTIVTHAASLILGDGQTALIPPNRQKHKLVHSAAVKALAFAPWQPSLLATGGGSNDRCIHFYHTPSGSCLATINVHAQVTSLIWSRTRRELAATFGYAQPEHPFRIAVFSWPSCEQVVGIPWDMNGDGGRLGSGAEAGPGDCGRALWAISYPGGPNDSAPESDGFQPRANYSSASSVTLIPTAGTPASATPAGTLTPTGGSVAGPPGTPPTPTSPRAGEREGGTWWSRTAEEGCIIVASSDETVKFHEVWSGVRKSTAGGSGLLGGSDILESLEGFEKEGKEIIR